MDQIELFPGLIEKDERRIPIGNGYAIEWLSQRFLNVYRYGIPYKIVEINAGIDRRRLVVELVWECGATKSKVAKALDVSRQSIDNWIETFKKAGYEGLVNSYKGSLRKGRDENRDHLPRGNKARQLEQERRQKREASHRQQLSITVGAAETISSEDADVFNEEYEYQENRYAGSFLYWGIFQHFFNFMAICESCLGSYALVVYLFAMMLVQGIESVEQLKGVFKREFGRVIGIKQLMSKPRLWEMIHKGCFLRRSRSLIDRFFEYCAQNSLVSLWWLYIDGHFIPYYGNERIHKGYYTQRDMMMPGQTEIYVHDSHGQIVYFDIQEGKGDIKGMMRTMSQKWSAYLDGTSPLIVADRESWGVEHFLSLEGCRFVTWEKFSDKEGLFSIPQKAFGPVFYVNGKGYQAYEEKKEYKDGKGNRITLRRVVIWNKERDERVACVAQDELEDTTTIATAMLGRWGCSENSFKHMGERWNMDYNPVVETLAESKNQEIPNPDHTKLKKQVRQLKTKLARCERKLGRLPLSTNNDGSLRKSSKRERLQKQRDELEKMLATAQQRLKNTKEKIMADEAGSLKILDTEGKNLWDIAQALVWNSRKKLIHLFKEFLPNPRDLIPILDVITKGKGWVKSTPEAIEIRLEPLDIPRYRAAQIQLCRALNEKEIRLKNGKRLFYDVELEPAKMSKKLATK